MELEEIKETFSFFTDWESKYRYIIDLGKELPDISEQDKTDQNLIRGCQSQVWLTHSLEADQTIKLRIDSDAYIVRGVNLDSLGGPQQQTPQRDNRFRYRSPLLRAGTARASLTDQGKWTESPGSANQISGWPIGRPLIPSTSDIYTPTLNIIDIPYLATALHR